jgi:hypothetical protein
MHLVVVTVEHGRVSRMLVEDEETNHILNIPLVGDMTYGSWSGSIFCGSC